MINAGTTVTPELARGLQPFALPISETKHGAEASVGGGPEHDAGDMALDWAGPAANNGNGQEHRKIRAPGSCAESVSRIKGAGGCADAHDDVDDAGAVDDDHENADDDDDDGGGGGGGADEDADDAEDADDDEDAADGKRDDDEEEEA